MEWLFIRIWGNCRFGSFNLQNSYHFRELRQFKWNFTLPALWLYKPTVALLLEAKTLNFKWNLNYAFGSCHVFNFGQILIFSFENFYQIELFTIMNRSGSRLQGCTFHSYKEQEVLVFLVLAQRSDAGWRDLKVSFLVTICGGDVFKPKPCSMYVTFPHQIWTCQSICGPRVDS